MPAAIYYSSGRRCKVVHYCNRPVKNSKHKPSGEPSLLLDERNIDDVGKGKYHLRNTSHPFFRQKYINTFIHFMRAYLKDVLIPLNQLSRDKYFDTK